MGGDGERLLYESLTGVAIASEQESYAQESYAVHVDHNNPQAEYVTARRNALRLPYAGGSGSVGDAPSDYCNSKMSGVDALLLINFDSLALACLLRSLGW